MNNYLNKKLLYLIFLLCLFGNTVYSDTLYWYLAASISKPGIEITQKFNASQSEFKVVVIPGGSGNLFSKLLASQTGDLYTPAASDYLEKSNQAGIVLTVTELLKQTPVFGLSSSGSKVIRNFSNLLKPGIRLALGNENTMALGKTYLKIEKKLPLNVNQGIQKNTIVKAMNVNQIVNYVKLDVVDAGIMFETVANSHGLAFINIPERSNVIETAYLITLKFSKHPKQVEKFKKYLAMDKTIFSKYGFHLEIQR
jgi:molybdate transport system substrate-binding protein